MTACLALVAVLAGAPGHSSPPVTGKAWVTRYDAGEGRQGVVGSRGNRLKVGDCASNLLPWGTRVEVAGRTYTVRDRGARSNDRIAKRRGAEIWLDLWQPNSHLRNVSGVVSYRIIARPSAGQRRKR
jgi:hypothetical protein